MTVTAGEAINGVSTFSELLNNYGPAIVILAVFLILFLYLTLHMLSTNQKNMQNMIDQNKAYVDQIMETNKNLIKTALEETYGHDYDEKNIVEIFVKLNETLKDECRSTLEKTNAERTAVYVFHNGASASHGLPFFKLSCISEWIKRGSESTSRMKEHTNIPLSMFNALVTTLYNNGRMVVKDLSILANEDPFTHKFLASKRINSCVVECVYDSDNRIMGFVLAEHQGTLTESEIEYNIDVLRSLCAKIKPVLEFSDYRSQGKGN